MEIEELQKIQKEHDYEYWDHDSNELENIRHITLHVGKLLGKLAAYCEAHEHQRNFPTVQIKDEVVPDLLFYGLHLANMFNLQLDQQYLQRLKQNKERLQQN
ncbi:MAG TPA: hypothetical protein VJC39_00245 [Candidatus Nanoarchaeia archaeon]|nr:hypothetical protein [Candidatus Nanoarchaeia archaeon]